MSADEERLRDGLRHNPFAKLWGRKPLEPPAVPPSEPRTPARSDKVDPVRPAPAAKSAPPPSRERVIVRRERKGHGGKAVTIVEGPGLAGHDLTHLAREAAKALGTGARVEDGALVVQGEQTERLIAWLAARGFLSVARGN